MAEGFRERFFVGITSSKILKKLRGKKKEIKPVHRKKIQNVQGSQKYKIKDKKKKVFSSFS